MQSISIEESIKQKNFTARVFLECYSKFGEIDVLSEDYLTEFQTVVINDGQSLLLDLTSVILVYSLVFDVDRREELSQSYLSNSLPNPTNLGNHKNANTDFINHYLMTNFFKSELLEPFENYTLGFKLIKKTGNESLYFKYYNFVLSTLQKLIFTPDFAETIKAKSVKHKSINGNVKSARFKNMVDLFIKYIRDVYNKITYRY